MTDQTTDARIIAALEEACRDAFGGEMSDISEPYGSDVDCGMLRRIAARLRTLSEQQGGPKCYGPCTLADFVTGRACPKCITERYALAPRPQPAAGDAVRALPEKWLSELPVGSNKYSMGYDDASRHRAHELKAALSAAPVESGDCTFPHGDCSQWPCAKHPNISLLRSDVEKLALYAHNHAGNGAGSFVQRLGTRVLSMLAAAHQAEGNGHVG